ncbi:class F sortase [Geodermatophilus sp. CPCC 206100]|uniref:class F sortase n=1 Tax=Geodermatophilus sp. CPCC 206100 TaxID=3020054 RepID=UPI003B006E74
MRRAVAGVVLGLAVAVGTPAAWALTREPAAAGAPLEQALPAPAPATNAPAVTARDAAPAPAPEVPAPARLAVPALGIDAPVDPVGVADDGRMALPADVHRVGWYRFGPTPGAAGSAVLAGHVDDRAQGLGVLAALRTADAGVEVVVTDGAGTATRWRVVSREVVQKRELPLDRVFGRTGPPRLVLVTCGGPFLPETGSYRDNVVVVAEPLPW